MILIIILIAVVVLFTIMIALYVESHKPTEIDNDTDDVSVIFDEDKEDEEII